MSATVELDMQQLTAATQGQWRVPIEAVVAQEESPDQPVVWRYVPKGGDAQASASINKDATTDTGSDDGRNEGKSEGKQQEVSAQGTVEAVPVTVLQATGEGLVITGELSAGDRLVTAGASRMEAGEPVRPWVKEAGL